MNIFTLRIQCKRQSNLMTMAFVQDVFVKKEFDGTIDWRERKKEMMSRIM